MEVGIQGCCSADGGNIGYQNNPSEMKRSVPTKRIAGKENGGLRAVEKHGLGKASHPADPLPQGL